MGESRQKDRLQRAAEDTKYLMRPNQTHVAMIQSWKKIISITCRPRQLSKNRLGTCKPVWPFSVLASRLGPVGSSTETSEEETVL